MIINASGIDLYSFNYNRCGVCLSCRCKFIDKRNNKPLKWNIPTVYATAHYKSNYSYINKELMIVFITQISFICSYTLKRIH